MNAKKRFLQEMLLKDGALHRIGLEIAGHIRQEGRIHADEFWDLIQNVKVIEILLFNNVFVMLPYSDWIMFQSKLM